jgi:hypothetical protein
MLVTGTDFVPDLRDDHGCPMILLHEELEPVSEAICVYRRAGGSTGTEGHETQYEQEYDRRGTLS